MAKIYFKRYKKRISDGEITVEEAIELVAEEIPERWHEDVIAMIKENYKTIDM